jgi:hypothetical protein
MRRRYIMIPENPAILLSYVNMKLRNDYKSLKDFCDDEQVDMVDLCRRLDLIDYRYDQEHNQFV